MKKLFWLMLLLPLSSFSQEQEPVLLNGKIIFSSLNRSPINIINQTQKTGTTNDEDGDFQILVNLGDELLFSSVQYLPRKISIDRKILEMEVLVVELTPSVTELEQVTISNIDLSGNLMLDAYSAPKELVYTNQALGFPPASPAIPIEDRRLYTATTSASGIPLDAIINAISGRLKRLRKLKEAAELNNLVEKASHSLDKDFFTTQCKIPEEYLIAFMYFCSGDESFERLVNSNQKLDLMDFFKKKTVGFRKMRGWE